MDFSSLATQAAAHDAYFTGLMNQVPTFFATYGRNTINNKYIRHREGLLAASYKGDKKSSMNDDGNDENDDSDDEGDSRDANALFSANNQIPTPSIDSDDDEDVGFGAPKTYADPVELKKRLEKLRQLQPLPKLSRDEIIKRKDARKAKDAVAKAKGIKQKSKQSGGNISAAPAPVLDEAITPQHQSKKQKTSSKDGQQTVQLANMQFSKLLQPHEDRVIQEAATLNHSERNKKTTLSNKQRLQKVENFQQSVSKLRAEGKGEIADQMEHKAAVSNALARAMGDNVNDNVRSLKKFVKQDQKMKEKSQKKWKQIKKGEENKLNERMDSRNLHIRKKIEHKRDSRIARRKKD